MLTVVVVFRWANKAYISLCQISTAGSTELISLCPQVSILFPSYLSVGWCQLMLLKLPVNVHDGHQPVFRVTHFDIYRPSGKELI